MPENNNNVSNENTYTLPSTGVITDLAFGNSQPYEIGLGSTTRTAIEGMFSGLQEVIDDNEEVVSSALNDLEERKADKTDLSDYVEKSSTQGLLKNDGTVDTNTYLTTSGLSTYFNDVAYDSQTKHINFKNGNTVLAYVDATDFIKDGMVSNVEIDTPESGDNAGVQCLIISFNTDAGKTPIEIPLSDIFDSDDYYTKDEIDSGDRVVAAALNDLETNKANVSDLATVAISGSYNDLTNKPTIPAAQVQADWNQTTTTAADYIKNKPTVPTTTNSVTENNTDAVTSGAVWAELQSFDCGEY